MYAHFNHSHHLNANLLDKGSWVSVHRIGIWRVVRRSGPLAGLIDMDPISIREFTPRFLIGVCLALAAAGALTLSRLDRGFEGFSLGGAAADATSAKS